MGSTEELERRLEAEFAAARSQIRKFQDDAGRAYETVHQRYRAFLQAAHWIRLLVQPRLEVLARKFSCDARPVIHHGRHRYQSAVTCQFPSELAQIALKFALIHDPDIVNLFLDYDLDILPIYIRFTPHDRLVMPIEAFDEARVARWIDDRVVDFTRTYLQIQFTEPYQRDHMVSDPIANVRFPKSYAKMTLQYEGRTYYLISAETCWEFEKQHGIGAS
jgi:YHS domain-containing protein